MTLNIMKVLEIYDVLINPYTAEINLYPARQMFD